VVAIFSGVRGYLDKIDVGKIGRFEAQFISELKAKDPGVLDAIRTQLEIKPDIEKKLIAFLDSFAKSFS
jgi:F-type H+-transporting ATPase subunit alpha